MLSISSGADSSTQGRAPSLLKKDDLPDPEQSLAVGLPQERKSSTFESFPTRKTGVRTRFDDNKYVSILLGADKSIRSQGYDRWQRNCVSTTEPGHHLLS